MGMPFKIDSHGQNSDTTKLPHTSNAFTHAHAWGPLQAYTTDENLSSKQNQQDEKTLPVFASGESNEKPSKIDPFL